MVGPPLPTLPDWTPLHPVMCPAMVAASVATVGRQLLTLGAGVEVVPCPVAPDEHAATVVAARIAANGRSLLTVFLPWWSTFGVARQTDEHPTRIE
jgi:hypothetical protein